MATPYTPATSLLSSGRIGRAAWRAALAKYNPDEAAEIVTHYHEMASVYGLNPDIALAQAVLETGWFTDHLWTERRNPCGLGITERGVLGKDYGTPQNGIVAHLHHQCCYAYTLATCPVPHVGSPDPRHTFHDGRPALSHLQEPKPGRRWAEEPGYVAKIVTILNALPQEAKPMPKIAIASGHHNTDGGDQFEYQQTGELTRAVARHCRALGMDVRVVTPADGLGMFAGGIWDVAAAVVKLATGGWVPDIFLETHTEGGGGTGVFAIYPDAAGDVDTDVKDTLGPLVANRIAAATGLKLGAGGDGVMSERQTGVGAGGSRLGIFNKTAPIRASTTRLIIEYGAHDKEPDLSIVKRPGFYDAAGKATAQAFAAFLGVATQPVTVLTEPTPPDPAEPERRALLAFADTLPLVARGKLTREGVADLSEWGGGTAERIAIYERLVAHRLAGANYVLTLDLWDQIRKQGKVTLY